MRFHVRGVVVAPRGTRRTWCSPAFSNTIKSTLRQCGIDNWKDYSGHGLRASAACELLEAGCNESLVAAITGHKDLKVLRRYLEEVNQEKRVLKAMDPAGLQQINRPTGPRIAKEQSAIGDNQKCQPCQKTPINNGTNREAVGTLSTSRSGQMQDVIKGCKNHQHEDDREPNPEAKFLGALRKRSASNRLDGVEQKVTPIEQWYREQIE